MPHRETGSRRESHDDGGHHEGPRSARGLTDATGEPRLCAPREDPPTPVRCWSRTSSGRRRRSPRYAPGADAQWCPRPRVNLVVRAFPVPPRTAPGGQFSRGVENRMFSRFHVLFVGYSHGDVSMEYLAKGLRGHKTRFILVTPSRLSRSNEVRSQPGPAAVTVRRVAGPGRNCKLPRHGNVVRLSHVC